MSRYNDLCTLADAISEKISTHGKGGQDFGEQLFTCFMNYFEWPIDKIQFRFYKTHATDKSKFEGSTVPIDYRPIPIFFDPEDKYFHMQLYMGIIGNRTESNYAFDFQFKPHEDGYLVTLGKIGDDSKCFKVPEDKPGVYPPGEFTSFFAFVDERLQILLKARYDKFQDS